MLQTPVVQVGEYSASGLGWGKNKPTQIFLFFLPGESIQIIRQLLQVKILANILLNAGHVQIDFKIYLTEIGHTVVKL